MNARLHVTVSLLCLAITLWTAVESETAGQSGEGFKESRRVMDGRLKACQMYRTLNVGIQNLLRVCGGFRRRRFHAPSSATATRDVMPAALRSADEDVPVGAETRYTNKYPRALSAGSQAEEEQSEYRQELGLLKRLTDLLSKRHVTSDEQDSATWRQVKAPHAIVKESISDQYYDAGQSPMYLIRKWYDNLGQTD